MEFGSKILYCMGMTQEIALFSPFNNNIITGKKNYVITTDFYLLLRVAPIDRKFGWRLADSVFHNVSRKTDAVCVHPAPGFFQHLQSRFMGEAHPHFIHQSQDRCMDLLQIIAAEILK